MKHKDSVLFEDNHLLIADKPAGMLTQPDQTASESLETILKAYLKEKYQKKGNVYLHAVHRLDKQVSGITLFAKTSKALSRLNASMREKNVEKCYLALCEGHFEKKEGTLEHYIIHGDHKAEVKDKSQLDAKLSILSYQVIEENENSLVKITLTTGRYHQIRCQLQAASHPIVGDKKYGSKTDGKDAILLHHYKMKFLHPVTQEKLTILCFPPWAQLRAREFLSSQDQEH